MTRPLPLLHSVQIGSEPGLGADAPRGNVPNHVLTVSSIEQAQQLASEQLTGRGFIQYWPQLAEISGGIKPALMLGHALYWTRTWLKQHPERGGWFWKTAKEWQEATGLTQREQESARSLLREAGFWEEELASTPGAGSRLFYRLNIQSLCDKMISAAKAKAQVSKERWDDVFLLGLLGQPLAYYRALADLSGGVIGGLVLSHLLSELRSAIITKSIDPDGYFPYSVEQQRVTLALGTKSQRNARDALKKAGFVQEALTKGQRPTLVVSLNLAAILALLTGKGEPGPNTPAGRLARKAQDRAQIMGQDGNVTTLRGPVIAIDASDDRVAHQSLTRFDGGAKRHSRAALLSKHQGLSADESCPFVESRAALLSALYTKPISQKNSSSARERLSRRAAVTDEPGRWRSLPLPFEDPPHTPAPAQQPVPALTEEVERPDRVYLAPRDQLIWPKGIDVTAAMKVFEEARVELDHQLILDEVAGQMLAKHVPSPVGYLHVLVGKAMRGQFIPARAKGVAETRAAQAQFEDVLANSVNDLQIAGPRETAEMPAVAPPDEHLQRLKEIRKAMTLKISGGALELAQPESGEQP